MDKWFNSPYDSRRSHRRGQRSFGGLEYHQHVGLEPEVDVSVAAGSTSSNSEDSEEQSEKEVRHKGISHLIEVCNPNQSGNVENSRPSRKAVENAVHTLPVRTDAELASDMARLALVRKERERAALKREEEKKARESARQAAAERAQAKLLCLQGKRKPARRRAAGGGGGSEPTLQSTDHAETDQPAHTELS